MFKKLKSLYNSLGIGVKASMWFVFCNFFQKGISMLSVPIFTRIMSTEEYGIFSVYQSWYSILTIIMTLNLFAGVYNKGLIKFENDRDGFTSIMQGLSIVTTLLFIGIYSLNIDFWTKVFELEPIYMVSMFMELLFVPEYLYWSARQRFEYKYRALVIFTMIISLASPITGVITVLCSSNKAAARIVSYAAVQTIAGLIFFVYNTIKGKRFYRKDYWKYALGFNLPLIPHYLSQIALNQADRIMISRIIGSGQAAIYSVAYNISMIMSLITNAINSTFVPSLYNCLKYKKYDVIKRHSSYVILIAAFLTIFSMLFGPELIRIFAPVEYYEAEWIIPPVSMAVYFTAVYSLFVNVEFYFEKTKYVMYVSVAGAIINIGLNWYFIGKFGYLAAGYTTVVCYILFSIGHFLLFRYLNKKYLSNIQIINIKLILGISLLLIVIMFAILWVYKHYIIRYIIIFGSFIILCLLRKKILKILKTVISI